MPIISTAHNGNLALHILSEQLKIVKKIFNPLFYIKYALPNAQLTGPTLKVKGRALAIMPQVDTATTETLRYIACTKLHRTYLP